MRAWSACAPSSDHRRVVADERSAAVGRRASRWSGTFQRAAAIWSRTRARREALSRELLDRDRRILSLVAGMPFVRMVALSGSLAHLNAEGSADLDLFVITAPERVWSVTVAAVVLSKLLGWRKHLCMNYVVSEARDGDRSRRICSRRIRSSTCGRSSATTCSIAS